VGVAIGIDLGTTNSCVYAARAGEPQPVLNQQGGRTTPSVVAFTDKETLVGALAQRQAVTNPRRTVHAVKRLIGNKLATPEVGACRELYAYDIAAAANGDAWVRIDDRLRSPQEISALLLAYLKRTAEDCLGESVDEAVVTVPAFFNDSQRQATRDAGRIAGLNVRRLLNEPTAAAFAYGVHKSAEQTIAVFDLGGGTFDISILAVSEGVFEVLATAGERFLGGEDFDRRLVDRLVAELQEARGVDVRGDPAALQRVREAAQAAKHELTQAQSTTITLPFLVAGAEPVHLEREVTRAELEALVRPDLDRLEAPCRLALEDAGMLPEAVDSVILVGGMTRMPAVQERVAEIFGRKPAKDINPDEVVAIGAALQASVLGGEIEDVVLLDVTPHSLGLRIRGDRFSRVIKRNSRIPCRETKLFQPVEQHQDFVELEIYQGESDLVKDNTCLGRFMLTDLPHQQFAEVRVAVSFEIDVDGIVRVHAKEPTTGREATVRIQSSSGLTARELADLSARPHEAAVRFDDAGDDASARHAKVRIALEPQKRTGSGGMQT
jgi:molecular chaperone DnaK